MTLDDFDTTTLSKEDNVSSQLTDAVESDLDVSTLLEPLTPPHKEIKIFTGLGNREGNSSGTTADVVWSRRGDLTLILVLLQGSKTSHLLQRSGRLLEGLEVLLSPIPRDDTPARMRFAILDHPSYKSSPNFQPSRWMDMSARQRSAEIDVNTYLGDARAGFSRSIKESIYQTGNGGYIGGKKVGKTEIFVAVGKGVAATLPDMDVEFGRVPR
ncbi:hypothetical protein BT69DRAFT_1285820, partial [Atractiella rhizophila]